MLTLFLFSDWMESPMMGGANPDGVDAEVGNYWRTLYKLEKNFDSIPTAKRIAGKVPLITLTVCDQRVGLLYWFDTN